uniref:Uncharacterized protein n=1 Tax=Rhizophora mucronata TaxID=61149 RepID=A0A2P2QPQ8_RHIMU
MFMLHACKNPPGYNHIDTIRFNYDSKWQYLIRPIKSQG